MGGRTKGQAFSEEAVEASVCGRENTVVKKEKLGGQAVKSFVVQQ